MSRSVKGRLGVILHGLAVHCYRLARRVNPHLPLYRVLGPDGTDVSMTEKGARVSSRVTVSDTSLDASDVHRWEP